ncbi:hypothetical protein RD792_004462 [Penstemon davidsonii]|uniref:Uncharacterized protein n=1 Tax=Penstemon davidsonii TaxID=160366 RepID=A0ABR0DHG4_9LAMI|nr:hypothetical protein RD792_004462 [Penstemon davidsonii]
MYWANEISNARRRAFEITSGNDPVDVISKDARKPMAQLKPCNSGSARKSKKPRWLRIVTKNLVLLVVLISSLEMIRRVVLLSSRGGGNTVENLGGSITELENFVDSVVKTMQVQLNAIDRKVEESIGLVRKEFDEKMEETELKLMGLDARSNVFENFINGYRKKSLLTMEEFDDFFEEFSRRRKKNRGGVNGDEEVSLDEIMVYTRGIVVNEIERHAADGLGMVDYALALGGGRVVEHSEPYEGSSGG